jgi:nucleotide-binding universal stress UspA family protein
MYERILVPVDGSETSKRGLKEAIRLAKEQGARLKCLHVIDEHFLAHDYLGFAYMPDLFESLRKNGETILEEASEEAEKGGVSAESVLRESGGIRVSERILDEANAWAADLIVMGTHGRRGISHLALGSDAELVVRGSTVPVLLVRTRH